MTDSRNVLGLPWYAQHDYARVVQIMEDPQSLPPTFGEWSCTVDYLEAQAHAAGIEVIRAPLQPDAFLHWCEEKGLRPNGYARTLYAREVAARETDARPS